MAIGAIQICLLLLLSAAYTGIFSCELIRMVTLIVKGSTVVVCSVIWVLWVVVADWCSVEVILRAEAVDTAQAGDRCDFVGTLIVVPDVGSMSMPGEWILVVNCELAAGVWVIDRILLGLACVCPFSWYQYSSVTCQSFFCVEHCLITVVT